MTRGRSRGWSAALIIGAAVWLLGPVPSGTRLGTLLPAQAAEPVRVLIDDIPLTLIPPATVEDAFLYLPLRPLAQHFQATLTVDKQVIEVHRTDGVIFTLRLGRLEIWSGGMAVAVTEAPVRLVNGVTMIPRGAVDVLFDTLTVWNRQEQQLVIVTRKATTFQTTMTTKPLPAPTRVVPGVAAHAFVPEFKPQTEPPLLASGYLTVGLALGGGEVVGTSRLQFRTHTGPDRLEGTMAMSAGTGSFQTAGTMILRRPTSTLTVGGLSINDSPLTIYEQGLVGLLYQTHLRRTEARFFGGNIPNSSTQVYGMSVTFPPVGQWLLQGGLLYDPGSGALVLKGRADRLLRKGLSVFGELAGGSSNAGSGTAWRVGVTAQVSAFTASVSYLSLADGFPTVGNASLFSGRSGPLVQLSYRPNPHWTFIASGAALRGQSTGTPDRYVYSLLVSYRPIPVLGIVGEARSVEDTTSGVRTRSTSAQAAVTFTTGRWGFVLAASQQFDANLLLGTTTGTSTFSLRAGHALINGLPVWAELSRSLGDTEAWGVGVGWSFRVSPRMDLNAQLRHKIYTLPSAYSETSLEVGLSQPLQNGANLTLGAGLRYNSSTSSATPYLAFQYGYPVYMRGDLRVGRLEGVMFVDLNGNGRRDPGEPGVPGVILRIDDRTAAMSDDAGKAVVAGMPEGDYHASLGDDSIPANLAPVQISLTVRVAANGTTTVEFPLVPTIALRGVVYFDENNNGARDRNEKGIAGVVIRIVGRDQFRTTEDDGTFDFLHLPAGEYTVIVDQRSLPRGFKTKGDGAYVVTLRPGGSIMIEIPLLEGKTVIQTFP